MGAERSQTTASKRRNTGMNLSCIVRSRYGLKAKVRVTLVDVMSSVECVVSEMLTLASLLVKNRINDLRNRRNRCIYGSTPGWPTGADPCSSPRPFTAFATPFATSEAPPVATAVQFLPQVTPERSVTFRVHRLQFHRVLLGGFLLRHLRLHLKLVLVVEYLSDMLEACSQLLRAVGRHAGTVGGVAYEIGEGRAVLGTRGR